jgi:hypothetical protein
MTHIHISALSSDMNPQVGAWSRRSGSNRRPAAYKLVRAKRCADLRICWSRSSVRAPVGSCTWRPVGYLRRPHKSPDQQKHQIRRSQ